MQALRVSRKDLVKAALIIARITGACLLLAGLAGVYWIGRPYIVLWGSPRYRAALEDKARSGRVEGDRIVIPALLIDAEIKEGRMPKNFSNGVVHPSDSATPGQPGVFVLEGHNLAEFGFWQPRSFFSLLDVAGRGTRVYVFYKDAKYVYEVTDKKQLKVDDPRLYDMTGPSRLRLVSCVSTWSLTIYTDWRTVVTAKPLSAGASGR